MRRKNPRPPPNPSPDQPYFSPAELATLLRLHPGTVYNRISAGTIQVRRVGRKVLIPNSEAQLLLSGNGNGNKGAADLRTIADRIERLFPGEAQTLRRLAGRPVHLVEDK
jgi:excisionase family DNA binding protein